MLVTTIVKEMTMMSADADDDDDDVIFCDCTHAHAALPSFCGRIICSLGYSNESTDRKLVPHGI